MMTVEFITALFYEVDEQLRAIPKHPRGPPLAQRGRHLGTAPCPQRRGQPALLSLVDARLSAIISAASVRTRLFRLLKTHQDWTRAFLAAPTVLGVIDTYGIGLIHPMREGRSSQQIGRKGLSNHRWIVGGKLYVLLDTNGG